MSIADCAALGVRMTLSILAVNVHFLDENELPRPDKAISLTIVPDGLKPTVLGKVSAEGALVMKLNGKKRPLANRCAIL